MASKKIWLLTLFLLWTNVCEATQYSSLNGAIFSINKNSNGEFFGHIVGTDMFFKNDYCKNKNMHICLSLGPLAVNLPNESFLRDGALWVGSFGEQNSVEFIQSVTIFNVEFHDLYLIIQDWKHVKNSKGKSFFKVYISKKFGIIAFQSQDFGSALWLSNELHGWKFDVDIAQ